MWRGAEWLRRHAVRHRFLTACKALGLERMRTITIHHGRYTFISHALAGGRTLADVRDAAGHANVSVTIAYLHIAVGGRDGGRSFSILTKATAKAVKKAAAGQELTVREPTALAVVAQSNSFLSCEANEHIVPCRSR